MSAKTHVLALNMGSSSLKFALYCVSATLSELLISGKSESIGADRGEFRAWDARHKELIREKVSNPSLREAIARIARLLTDFQLPTPAAIGHRIVHGGRSLRQHCLIDQAVLNQLSAASAFAPLHTPAALSVIFFAHEYFPTLPQVACFDTAFHATLPPVAQVLPIAKALHAQGIQRYGFHGLSCESIVQQLLAEAPHRLPERLIVAQLGNGASITAIRAGQSVDTSMGMTPTGGVIMGTRSGDLDPGVVIHLIREQKFNAAMLEDLVERGSGLLGISGVSSDMRQLREAAASNADAQLAIEMFNMSVRKQLAAMIAVSGGVDLIVFTGGIGENDAEGRAAICAGLSWMGVHLDESRNRVAKNPISESTSRCVVRVLISQEDERIAHHTRALIASTRTAISA